MISSEMYDQLNAIVEKHCGAMISNGNDKHSEELLGALVESAGALLIRALSEAENPFWVYFRIGVDGGMGNAVMTKQVFPILRDMQAVYPVHGWWWLNKTDTLGPALRLRVSVPREARAEVRYGMQKRLEAAGCNARLLRYEPELCLFGGPVGIQIAHDQFCADSRFLAGWMANCEPIIAPVIPEGLSLTLIMTMLRACGLDVFEIWDVLNRVLLKRDFFSKTHRALDEFKRVARTVIESEGGRIFDLYSGQRTILLTQYLKDIQDFANNLNRAYFQGELGCGLREFLVPVILFHWNRIDLSSFRQFALAYAAAECMENMSRKSSAPKTTAGESHGA